MPCNATSNALNSVIGFVTLEGSHFKDPLYVTPIAISGFCSLAFIMLVFISWRRKVASEWSRKKFAVLSSVLIGMFFGYMRSLVDGIIHELQFDVPKAYLIIPALKPIIANGTDITLIGLIDIITKNRFRKITPGGYIILDRIHKRVIVSLLALLGLADTVLYIDVQGIAWGKTIESLFCRSFDNTKGMKALVALADWYQRIHLLYTSIFFVVTLEIGVCIILILKRSPMQSLRSRIVTYLLVLVSPALIVRAAAVVAQAALYVYLNYYESRWVEILASMLWDIPAILIYTGLILIQYQKDWESEDWSVAHGDVVEQSPSLGMSQQNRKVWKEPTVSRVDTDLSLPPLRSNTGSSLSRTNTGSPLLKPNTASPPWFN